MGFIMPLVNGSLGADTHIYTHMHIHTRTRTRTRTRTHTHTHTHTHTLTRIQTFTDRSNLKKPGAHRPQAGVRLV